MSVPPSPGFQTLRLAPPMPSSNVIKIHKLFFPGIKGTERGHGSLNLRKSVCVLVCVCVGGEDGLMEGWSKGR